jgi:hypothetical protein
VGLGYQVRSHAHIATLLTSPRGPRANSTVLTASRSSASLPVAPTCQICPQLLHDDLNGACGHDHSEPWVSPTDSRGIRRSAQSPTSSSTPSTPLLAPLLSTATNERVARVRRRGSLPSPSLKALEGVGGHRKGASCMRVGAAGIGKGVLPGNCSQVRRSRRGQLLYVVTALNRTIVGEYHPNHSVLVSAFYNTFYFEV